MFSNTIVTCAVGLALRRPGQNRGRNLPGYFRVPLAVTLGVLGALATLELATFHQMQDGLEGSWGAALGEAGVRGDHFGTDIIFTGGPLSALYTRYFDPTGWPWVLAAGASVAWTIGWTCAKLAHNWYAVILVPTAILLGPKDAVLLSLPALAAIAVLGREPAPRGSLSAVAVATAAICLAKFSIAPIAIGAFVAIDLKLIKQKRLPTVAAVFLLSSLGWFWLAGGKLGAFASFVKYSAVVSAGYSAGMAFPGDFREPLSFALLSSVVIAIMGICLFRGPQRADAFGGLSILAVTAVFLFTVFKAGFVRHDLHSIIAWGGMAILTAAAAGARDISGARRLGWEWAALSFAVLSLGASATIMSEINAQVHVELISQVRARLESVWANLGAVRKLAVSESQWLNQQELHRRDARATVRAAMPLPQLKGTVDVVPSIQSAVIAADLEYRPRFTIQEYAAYSAPLIEKNRQAWFGARPPDNILFGFTPIDDRYPALSEGPLWPELIRFYEPTSRMITGSLNLATLSRRDQPIADPLGAPDTRTVKLGERFQLLQQATFIRMGIEPTAIGRLLTFLFRPPIVNLDIEYADGTTGSYRIIPDIVREGFVISPYVQNADEFVALSFGDMSLFGPSSIPAAARIRVGRMGSVAYEKDVVVTARPIDINTLSKSTSGDRFRTGILQEIDPIGNLTRAVRMAPPRIVRVSEGLLAHAPSRLRIPVAGASAATVAFGLLDGAWNGRDTDGACFRALSESGSTLWQRCLDPKHVVSDRGRQVATFDLVNGEATVILETSCGRNCDWDWTYWGGLTAK